MKGFRTPKGVQVKERGRVPKKVKDACKAFIIEKKLPFGQYGILLGLALQSYKNCSLDEREHWTLEQVISQGL